MNGCRNSISLEANQGFFSFSATCIWWSYEAHGLQYIYRDIYWRGCASYLLVPIFRFHHWWWRWLWMLETTKISCCDSLYIYIRSKFAVIGKEIEKFLMRNNLIGSFIEIIPLVKKLRRSYWIILTHFWTFWQTLEHVDTFCSNVDTFGLKKFGSCWHIFKHFDAHWSILTPLGSCWHILDHIDISLNILTHIGACWHILDHVGTYWIIHVFKHFDTHWGMIPM